MKSFLQAIAFLTRFPVPPIGNDRDWKKSPMWYPVVGFLIGILLLLFDQLIAIHFPHPIRAGLDLAFWVWITGGLHIDGLLDTADGLLSHRDRERVMEIMKDSRVGAMGVLTAILYLLLKWLALKELIIHSSDVFMAGWIVALVVGRFSAVLGMFVFPYVRPQGIGAGMKEGLTLFRFGFAWVVSIVLVGFLMEWKGILYAGITWGMMSLFAWRVSRRLGGLTGDVYGAMIEGAELLMLLLLTIEGGVSFANVMVTPW